jgi:hypothetical protein
MASTKKVNKTQMKRRLGKGSPGKQIPEYEGIPSLEDINCPPEDFFSYHLAIYGEKGVGKTSLASQWPNALTFMFERGRRNLPIRQIPRRLKDGSMQPPLTWNEMDKPCTPFLPLLMEAVEDKSVKTIVLDTIDRAYEACFEYACWEEGVSHPNAASEGHQVWQRIKDELEHALALVSDAGKQLVLISHARDKKIISRLGGEYDIVCATCTPTAWKVIQTICDFVFYYGFHGSNRAMMVRGNDQIVCSNQVPGHFLDPEGRPVSIIPMGSNAQEAFQQIQLGFDNKLYDMDQPETTATTTKKKKRRRVE